MQDRIVVLLYEVDTICEYLDNRNGPEFEIPYQLDRILSRRVIKEKEDDARTAEIAVCYREERVLQILGSVKGRDHDPQAEGPRREGRFILNDDLLDHAWMTNRID